MIVMVMIVMVVIVMVVTMMVMLCKCDVGKLLDDPVMILRTEGGLGSCARLRQGTKSRQLHATGERKVCQRMYLGLSVSSAKGTLCGVVGLSKSLSARPLCES